MTHILNLEEAAKLLRFESPECLRQKVKAGEIPGTKLGRSWIFIEEDLIEHIRRGYTAPIGEPCPSTKRKALPSITHALGSKALRCANLRKQLLNKKP